MVGDDAIFLQGCFIEIGISDCGVYGTAEDPPTGPYGEYHGINFNGLGFIADHEKDGWDVATGSGEPDFCGDYFSPGSPEEGWAIQIGSDIYENHYIGCDGYASSTSPDIDGEVISYADAGGLKQGVWEGNLDEDGYNLSITQTTTFPNGALFFLTKVEICNDGTEDIEDLYYMRNVDPDQDVDHCSSYGTTNEIIYNPPDDDTALVSAIGDACGCYLGIGAIDERARVSFGNFFIYPATPEGGWSADATEGYSGSGSTACDCAIQITFQVDIEAGECETIYFAHILDPSDLQEALEATLSGGVGITANGVSVSASGEYGVCNVGDTVILEINGDPGVSWTISPSTYLDTDTGTYIVAVPLETTTYTITGIGGECGDVTTDITLVIAEPVADAGADTEICYGLSTTLNGTGGEAYEWTPATGLSDNDIPNPVASPTETTTYFLTTFDIYGCPAYDEVTITVNPLPTVSAGPDVAICIDGQVTLDADGAVTYSWSPTTGLSDPDSETPICTVDEETTYTVTGTDANGCENTDEITVSVNYLPPVTATATPPVIDSYLGETSQLIATGGVTYVWTPTTGLSDPNIYNPVASPQDTTTYIVMVTDAYGCVNYDTVTVFAIGEITIDLPTAFSPNGDGFNDYYFPIVQGSGQVLNYTIFNRWGEIVYTGAAGDAGWDGTQGGEASEIGSYTIIVNATTSLGEARFEKGYFVLVR
jgi:gliding motility-associated-like protein